MYEDYGEPDETTLEDRMSTAEKTGRPLEMLLTMRRILAERLDSCAPRDTASIARQLERVIGLVAELESGTTVTDDKIAAFMTSEWKAQDAWN
jgi:hypothetical protein